VSKTDNQTTKRDLFAQIAAQRETLKAKTLFEPAPVKVSRIVLESKKSDPKASFKPSVKMSTREDLDLELQRQREKFEPFMADLSPAIELTRQTFSLVNFGWHLETEAEKNDFGCALRGEGAWDSVTIPHYGGPLGRARAYYRTGFQLNENQIRDKACWICFKGVDYKAHVFMNGTYLGSHEGFFAPFEFEFSACAKPGENILVVRVENDAICMGNDSWGADGHLYHGDKIYAATGMGYDDPEIGWHHCPPGMGIYQDVYVDIREKMHIADIFVRPFLSEKKAEAWLEVESTYQLQNDATLEFSIFGQNFRQVVTLPQRHAVNIGPTRNYYRFPVEIKNPKAWNPDSPWLYQIQVRLFDKDGKLLDTAKQQFGMRDFKLDTDSIPKGNFLLNGRGLKLRGANEMGYIQQCVAKKEWGKLRDAILLAKICNMNFLRLTQRPVQPEIYELCDKLGLMTQTDLPLFGMMRRNQFCEGVRQANEMERLVRSHPCNIMVTYINEPFPNAADRAHRQLTADELDMFFRACDQAVRLANPDRLIKHVDGDYDPPHEGLPDNHCYNCWYNGHGLPIGKLVKGYWQRIKPDWNYACGEFGAEGLDPVETMYKYYPKDWLPANRQDEWNPQTIIQAQTARFHYMWFPTQKTIDAWVSESQRHQAWATRIMTEAMRRDPRMVSFAIHLFIDAFPAGWMKAIMDVDTNPKPAFFEYREALMPVAANIRTSRAAYFAGEKLDMDFWICNDRSEVMKDCQIRYQVRNGKNVIFSAKKQAKINALSPNYQGKFQFTLPKVGERTRVDVELAGVDKKGKIIHDTAVEINVFPKLPIKKATVFVLGKQNGPAWNLVRELGLMPKPWKKGTAGTIISDSLKDVQKNISALESAVRDGSRLILTELERPEGEFKFAQTKVTFAEAGMGARLFVNCSTSHSLVEGFHDYDFFMWHNSATDTIEPFLAHTMTSEEAESVLLSGNGDWRSQQWNTVQAAVIKSLGQGQLIISLPQLLNRTKTNPTAREYALRLLGK